MNKRCTWGGRKEKKRTERKGVRQSALLSLTSAPCNSDRLLLRAESRSRRSCDTWCHGRVPARWPECLRSGRWRESYARLTWERSPWGLQACARSWSPPSGDLALAIAVPACPSMGKIYMAGNSARVGDSIAWALMKTDWKEKTWKLPLLALSRLQKLG